MKSHFYESIQGQFDFQDIYEQAVQEAHDGSRFVEVGSWLGRPAAFMAVEIANSGKKIDFYTVATDGASVREAFDSNMERGGVGGVVTPIEAPSVDAAAKFADGSLDFVFIDAPRDFVNVFADVRAWYPKVKPGGVIAGHDIGPPTEGAQPSEALRSWVARELNSAMREVKGRFGDQGSIDLVNLLEANLANIAIWAGATKPDLTNLTAAEAIAAAARFDPDEWVGPLAAVQQRVPARSIKERVNSWWFRKPASVDAIFEDASGLRDVQGHLLFIPVVNRLDLLKEAVDSVPSSVSAVVVDQTDGLGDEIKALLPGHVGYVKTPKRLLFSEMQNAMLHTASLLGIKTLMFMHSDGKCDPSVVDKLVQASSDESDWGVIFTNYDVLCAFNVPELLDRVGFWDETFEWYASDCDYYRRVRIAGLRIVETGLTVEHRPSSTVKSDVAEMNRVEAGSDKRRFHYMRKWGGLPGRELNDVPYAGNHR